MNSRRVPAGSFAVLFLATAFAPLVGASTEPTFNGDVVINGDFSDATPTGHWQKFYCGPNNPTPVEGPGRECGAGSSFVAHDWTAPSDQLDAVQVVADGLRLQGDVFVQQHFNGTDAPDRLMELFRVAVTGHGAGTLRVEVRADADGAPGVESYARTLTFSATETTFDLSRADLGVPAGEQKLRSIRLWAGAGADLTLARVEVHATNGIEARNIHVLSGGDDVVTPGVGAMALGPGPDGVYTFRVGMAADDGDLLPTLDAWLCFYDADQAVADQGYPANVGPGGLCQGAYMRSSSTPGVVKRAAADAFEFDVPASAAIPPAGTFSGAFGVYATIKVDGSYDVETPGGQPEFKSGYLHAARIAADAAGRGVAEEYYGPTPVVIDADGNGVPDHAQSDNLDGFVVAISPQGARATGPVTVLQPSVDGELRFDVQVWSYDGATGEPLTLRADGSGFMLNLFDAAGMAADPTGAWKSSSAFWSTLDHPTSISVVDATTYRVTVDADDVGVAAVAAWAYYDVDGAGMRTAVGPVDPASDFYSALQTAAADLAVADAFRGHATPLVLAPDTVRATTVVRVGAGESYVPVPGGIALNDKDGDGALTFEYALVLANGDVLSPGSTSGALAVYDAAGFASDGLSPGASQLQHAEFWAHGDEQADGWYAVDVPLSALADAKGPIGVYAYVDDAARGLSQPTLFSVWKAAVVGVSVEAAEALSFVATPVIVTETETGLPKTLAATMAGAGHGVLSVTNPLVNPGFEASLLVEGTRENNDAYSARMTSPPWFFRLDDSRGGTPGQSTTPRSTHEVVSGQGSLGSNALLIKYEPQDRLKGLALGQLFAPDDGPAAYVWKGATGVSFDALPAGTSSFTMKAVLRYEDATGALRMATGQVTVPNAGVMTRHTVPFAVPADGKLLGLFLQPDSAIRFSVLLDNVVLEGAKTSMGDARSDLTDGFAMIIEPRGLAGATQGVYEGVDASYLVYDVHAVDYTQGSPRVAVPTGDDVAFGLRADALHRDGIVLAKRGGGLVAVHDVEDVPAEAAAPWAFIQTGASYAGPDSAVLGMHQTASGYYNPVKNSLKGSPVADHLDYAGTPVVFDAATVVGSLVAPQDVRFVEFGADFRVLVTSPSELVETTTVTVSKGGSVVGTYTVELASATGDLVPGLVIAAADIDEVTVKTSDTLFTEGKLHAAGAPQAAFEVCRPGLPGCVDASILSRESLTFRSTTLVPTEESYTSVFDFGDGTTPATTTTGTATHSYLKPGTYTATLTVTTPSGRTDDETRQIVVLNRDPVVTRIGTAPASIFTDTTVTATAFASDLDGGTLSYAWKLDGAPVPGVTTRALTLTAARLADLTGLPTLQKRTYVLEVVVTDGQGGTSAAFEGTFAVGDRPTGVSLPTVTPLVGATGYALVGEPVRVAASVVDADDVVASVEATFESAEDAVAVPLALVAGEWTADVATLPAGAYDVTVLATLASGATAGSAGVPFSVRANEAPAVTVTGPSLIQAFENATFDASASVDPDQRGALTYEWSVDGDYVADGATFTYEPGADSGAHVVTLVVRDAGGAETTATMPIGVDDVYVASLAVDTYEFRSAVVATVRVLDETGAPVVGALVVFEDRYGPVPMARATHSATTDADGYARWALPRVGPIHLPGGHHVTATITGASRAGAVDAGVESATVEAEYDVAVLP